MNCVKCGKEIIGPMIAVIPTTNWDRCFNCATKPIKHATGKWRNRSRGEDKND